MALLIGAICPDCQGRLTSQRRTNSCASIDGDFILILFQMSLPAPYLRAKLLFASNKLGLLSLPEMLIAAQPSAASDAKISQARIDKVTAALDTLPAPCRKRSIKPGDVQSCAGGSGLSMISER